MSLLAATGIPRNDGGLGPLTTSEVLLLGFGLLITIAMIVGMVLLIIRFSKESDDG